MILSNGIKTCDKKRAPTARLDLGGNAVFAVSYKPLGSCGRKQIPTLSAQSSRAQILLINGGVELLFVEKCGEKVLQLHHVDPVERWRSPSRNAAHNFFEEISNVAFFVPKTWTNGDLSHFKPPS